MDQTLGQTDLIKLTWIEYYLLPATDCIGNSKVSCCWGITKLTCILSQRKNGDGTSSGFCIRARPVGL